MKIRKARLSDDVNIRLLNHANLPEKYSLEFIRYLLSSQGAHFIAEHEGEAIGYILSVIERRANIRFRNIPGRIGHIVSVAVDPRFRKKGIGSSLIKAVLEALRGKVPGVMLEVRISNEPAISLYSKLGFSTMEIREHYYSDGETALVMIYRYRGKER